MQSNFFRYNFGLEWEKCKIVRIVHAKRILQTAPYKEKSVRFKNKRFIFSAIVKGEVGVDCWLLTVSVVMSTVQFH